MEENLKEAIETLRNGGVIAHPTDTVPGLGADATNDKAIERVYHIKQRDPQKPLLILCKDMEMVEKYVETIPPMAYELTQKFPEIPITIIYPRAKNLPTNVPHPSGSIGVRIPAHKPTLRLIEAIGKPLASTSANLSGMPTPNSISNIHSEVLKLVDYILTLPGSQKGTNSSPSWILMADEEKVRVIREGDYSEQLAHWLNAKLSDT